MTTKAHLNGRRASRRVAPLALVLPAALVGGVLAAAAVSARSATFREEALPGQSCGVTVTVDSGYLFVNHRPEEREPVCKVESYVNDAGEQVLSFSLDGGAGGNLDSVLARGRLTSGASYRPFAVIREPESLSLAFHWTLLLALAAACFAPLAVALRRRIQRRRWRGRGCCETCGYDVSRSASSRCSECGRKTVVVSGSLPKKP